MAIFNDTNAGMLDAGFVDQGADHSDEGEPATFKDVMDIDDFEDRASTAREHGFQGRHLLAASLGSGPEAQLNRAIWCEDDFRDSVDPAAR